MGVSYEKQYEIFICSGVDGQVFKPVKVTGLLSKDKSLKPLKTKLWDKKDFNINLEIVDSEKVRELQKILAESLQKQIDEFYEKVEKAIENIFRNYLTPPIKGEITKGKIRWRGVKCSLWQEQSDGSKAWIGIVQRDTIIFANGQKMPYKDYLQLYK